MKNIKDITISIFAVIGFVAIITAFTNQPEQANQPTTPESHVWELLLGNPNTGEGRAYLYNKVTGEVRKYAKTWPSVKGVDSRVEARSYIVTKEIDF